MKLDSQQAGQGFTHKESTTSRMRSYGVLVRLSRRLGRVAVWPLVRIQTAWNGARSAVMNGARGPSVDPSVGTSRSPSFESPSTSPAAISDKQVVQGARSVKGDALSEVVRQSNEVLASANTVFPITLFPDTVFVDRSKVTIIRRDFFWSSDTISIRIEDILNVSASVGPLFGSLTVASRVMSTVDHFKINYFWRHDAIHLKHVIQGYVIAQHDRLATAHLSADELVKLLEELGHDSNS